MTLYARPRSLVQALDLLSGSPRRLLAGGTDIYPGVPAQLPGAVLDLTALPELRGIKPGDGLRIGAATTWSEIAEARLPVALRALQDAARQVGGRQIQNAGTLGGNLCNASPAADGVPPLLVLGAEVELAGAGGSRRLALSDFITGPRKTALRADEILVAVHLPAAALTGKSAFAKLGARSHLVISIAMAAARLVMDGGRIVDCSLALGACSPVAMRLPMVESALIGATAHEVAGRLQNVDLASVISPISDIRATADYRLKAAKELVRQAVTEAMA